MTPLLIIIGIIILFVLFVMIGLWLETKKLTRLIKERDNVDVTTPEGKVRVKSLNKQIDRLYGFE